MKSVGQILQEERKRQNQSLSVIHQLTKIPVSALRKIEADQFRQLPPATFTKGFLQSYAQALGIDPARVLAVFRRDYIENHRGVIIPKALTEEVGRQGLGFNPKTFSLFSVIFVVLLLAVFLLFQLRTLLLPPKLTVEELPAVVTSREITIKGKVNREAAVSINDSLVFVEDKQFKEKVELRPGKNIIEVKAVDRRNKSSQQLIEIELDTADSGN